jgi:ParB family chromosome partitioning protein
MQNSSAFQYLAIDTIHESTTNPRRTFDETKLQELAESIKGSPHQRSEIVRQRFMG